MTPASLVALRGEGPRSLLQEGGRKGAMSGLYEAQLAEAKRLLAYEGASGDTAKECAAAAGRVFDKLNAGLGPLLGAAGVRALLARSTTLAGRDLGTVAGAGFLDSSTTLRTFLQDLEPAVAHRAAEALFAAFLSLITSFIGERLTLQAMRSAWPTLEAPGAPANEG